jgi:hypothetical protein
VFRGHRLTGFALNQSFSLTVTLGQDYLPTRIGTSSGVTLGLAISIGGLVTPALGALADATSLHLAVTVLATFPLTGLALALRLRQPRARRPVPRHVIPHRTFDPAQRTSSPPVAYGSASRAAGLVMKPLLADRRLRGTVQVPGQRRVDRRVTPGEGGYAAYLG